MEQKVESRSIAYLLEDVMQGRFERGFYQEDLWEYVKRCDKPVIEYAMEDVKHWVYAPCWSYEEEASGRECFVSIYQVLLQKKLFKDHLLRIREAETAYALIVIEDDFDKYGVILDGNHRFAKLVMERTEKVSIQYITKDELLNNLYRDLSNQ